MIKYGRLVVCENCGRVAFEEMNLGGRIGEHIYAIKEEGWRYGDQHDDNVTLCPCCHALFKNSKLPWMKNIEGRCVMVGRKKDRETEEILGEG